MVTKTPMMDEVDLDDDDDELEIDETVVCTLDPEQVIFSLRSFLYTQTDWH